MGFASSTDFDTLVHDNYVQQIVPIWRVQNCLKISTNCTNRDTGLHLQHSCFVLSTTRTKRLVTHVVPGSYNYFEHNSIWAQDKTLEFSRNVCG